MVLLFSASLFKGMSTCHEVVAARHCGLQVLGMSFISNMGIMDYSGDVVTQEQLDTLHDGINAEAMRNLQNLVSTVLERL